MIRDKGETIKVILNPYAGRGSAARNELKICQALNRANVRFDLAKTTSVGHAIDLARQARLEGYHTFAVAGGDGTVSEVVNGLAQVTPSQEQVGTLAILPVGSGNDFANTVGCPMDLNAAAEAIAKGQTRCVDLGQIKLRVGTQEWQRYFNNNLGAGFEGQLAQEIKTIKHLRGILIYIAAVCKALSHYTQPLVELTWQTPTGEHKTILKKVLMLSVGNSDRNGGGFHVTPQALLDDGLLDLAIGEAMPWYQILALLPKVIRGTHTNHPKIMIHQCCKIDIVCKDSLPVHADGELLTVNADALDIEIQPQRLKVIV